MRRLREGFSRLHFAVLLVGYFFHPLDGFSVECFLNRDVRQRRRERGAMPMLQTGWKPDHIARANFLNRAPLALHPPNSGGDYKRLP